MKRFGSLRSTNSTPAKGKGETAMKPTNSRQASLQTSSTLAPFLLPTLPGLAWLLLAIAAIPLLASKAHAGADVLYNFAGPLKDGSNSYSTLVNDSYGNLYGTTYSGGANNLGTVFVLCAPAPMTAGAEEIAACAGAGPWAEVVLYGFGAAANDGTNPTSTLIFGNLQPGVIYGTTYNGGAGACGGIGCGTVFELAPGSANGCPAGTNAGPGNLFCETVLYSFTGGADGQNPFAGVINDNNDNLYGTTVYGGGQGPCKVGANQFCGTVYELAPSANLAAPWTETILHRFAGGKGDGSNPYGALCCAANAAITTLYGTTVNGGAKHAGTVFSLNNAAGYAYNWLYHFAGPDGSQPYGNVVLDANDNVYTTASAGGANAKGTLIMLPQPLKADPVVPLYNFCSVGGVACTDGATPMSGPNLNFNTLFGTTEYGGNVCAAPGCGTVYDFTPNGAGGGVLIQQYAFAGPLADGKFPYGGVIPMPENVGFWIGTTLKGGVHKLGIVYDVP
jgi:uncharacterized repeat protein (TIGR03803 family)